MTIPQRQRGFARQAVLWIILALLGGGVGYVFFWRSITEQATAVQSQAPQSAPVVANDTAAPESSAPTLSERAAVALREGRFVLPAGDSALDYYAELLSNDSSNLDLQQALTDTLGLGAGQFDSAITSGDLATAEDVYRRMRAARPDYLLLPALRERLDAAQLAQTTPADPATDAQALPAEATADSPPAAEPAAAVAVPIEPEAPSSTIAQPATVGRDPVALEPEPAPAAQTSAESPAVEEPAPVAEFVAAVEPAPTPEPAAVVTPQPAAVGSEPELRQITPLQPNYPRQAMQRRVEGRVSVRFVVRADGRVADVEVASSTPPGVFDMEAVRAIQRVRFAPPGRDVNATRSIEFKLPR